MQTSPAGEIYSGRLCSPGTPATTTPYNKTPHHSDGSTSTTQRSAGSPVVEQKTRIDYKSAIRLRLH
jgi:hypothetical protein